MWSDTVASRKVLNPKEFEEMTASQRDAYIQYRKRAEMKSQIFGPSDVGDQIF